MPKRKLPLGYRFHEGQVEAIPQEAELVKHIYQQYLAGISLKRISDELEKQPIRYDPERAWNKAMVNRILQDQRYTGDGRFPALIAADIFSSIQEERANRPGVQKKSEVERTVGQLSSMNVTSNMTQQITAILNRLIEHPELIKAPQSIKPEESKERVELKQIVAQLPLDEDRARALAMSAASSEYRMIDPAVYETVRIRRIFERAQPIQQLDTDLLRSVAASIDEGRKGVILLQLKNQQMIGVTDDEGRAS